MSDKPLDLNEVEDSLSHEKPNTDSFEDDDGDLAEQKKEKKLVLLCRSVL